MTNEVQNSLFNTTMSADRTTDIVTKVVLAKASVRLDAGGYEGFKIWQCEHWIIFEVNDLQCRTHI